MSDCGKCKNAFYRETDMCESLGWFCSKKLKPINCKKFTNRFKSGDIVFISGVDLSMVISDDKNTDTKEYIGNDGKNNIYQHKFYNNVLFYNGAEFRYDKIQSSLLELKNNQVENKFKKILNTTILFLIFMICYFLFFKNFSIALKW